MIDAGLGAAAASAAAAPKVRYSTCARTSTDARAGARKKTTGLVLVQVQEYVGKCCNGCIVDSLSWSPGALETQQKQRLACLCLPTCTCLHHQSHEGAQPTSREYNCHGMHKRRICLDICYQSVVSLHDGALPFSTHPRLLFIPYLTDCDTPLSISGPERMRARPRASGRKRRGGGPRERGSLGK